MGADVYFNSGAEVASDPERRELGCLLRATRPLRAGELVLREPPLLRVTGCGIPPPEVASPASALRAARLFVPGSDSAVVERLRAEARGDENEESFYMRTVLHFNSFAAGYGGSDRVAFATLARANHSCLPNCIVDGDEGTLRALRDIEPGDDLTISYLSDAALLWPRHRRQVELAQRWDFVCGCERCSAPLDDARRLGRCPADGCDGELLAAGAARGPPVLCARCGAVPNENKARVLLSEESAAVRALERAQNDYLEEEDQGQELIRCHRFASKYPTHAVALELAHDFAFPEVLPAQQVILDGLKCILPGLPCQLAVDAGRQLAELLAGRGDVKAAREALEAAAGAACILDGYKDTGEVLEGWGRLRPRPGTDCSIGPPGRPQGQPDLDLDLGPAPLRPAANGLPAMDASTQEPGAECTGRSQAQQEDTVLRPTVRIWELLAAQWTLPATLAAAVAAAAVAGALVRRHRGRA
uniref:SET domain-containing protein n=1 Tax=Alexandrium monilatum TaxID=311494 RepID=A0A7S4T7T0_9DINO